VTSRPTPQYRHQLAEHNPWIRCRTRSTDSGHNWGRRSDGLTRLSQTLSSRNESLRKLLTNAADVTGNSVAAQPTESNTLLLNANDLLGVLKPAPLRDRQSAGQHRGAVLRQLSGLVADNEKRIGATLEKLKLGDRAAAKETATTSQKPWLVLRKYQVTQGESVNNGFYYNAFVGNLLPSQALQPFLRLRVSDSARCQCQGSRPTRLARGLNSPSLQTAFPEDHDDRPHLAVR